MHTVFLGIVRLTTACIRSLSFTLSNTILSENHCHAQSACCTYSVRWLLFVISLTLRTWKTAEMGVYILYIY